MMSVQGLETRIGWSILSDEYKVLLAIYERWKRNQSLGSGPQRTLLEPALPTTGISYSELVNRLDGEVPARAISRALDILLEFGLVTPSYGEVSLATSGRQARRVWRRLYGPTGENRQDVDGIAQLIYRTKHGTAPRCGTQIQFASASLTDTEAFLLSCYTLRYALAFAHRLLDDDLSDLGCVTGAYKLLANVLVDMGREGIGRKQYVQVMPRQYGRIPIFPAGVINKHRTLRQLKPIRLFRVSGRTLLPELYDENECLEKLSRLGMSEDDVNRLEDHVSLYVRLARSTKFFHGFPVEALNIAVTSPDYGTALESARFEYDALVKWSEAFVQSISLYASVQAPSRTVRAAQQASESMLHWMGRWAQYPTYGLNRAPGDDPAPDDTAHTSFMRLRAKGASSSAKEVQERWWHLVEVTRRQATAACVQLAKKLRDVADKLPTLRDEVAALVGARVRHAPSLQARLIIPEGPQRTTARRVCDACDLVDQILQLGTRLLPKPGMNYRTPTALLNQIGAAGSSWDSSVTDLASAMKARRPSAVLESYRRLIEEARNNVASFLQND